jgi:hypothetical protein
MFERSLEVEAILLKAGSGKLSRVTLALWCVRNVMFNDDGDRSQSKQSDLIITIG